MFPLWVPPGPQGLPARHSQLRETYSISQLILSGPTHNCALTFALLNIRGYLDPEFVLATARYWGRYGGGTSVEPLEIVRETADMSTAVRPMSTGAESALRGRPQ